MRLDICIPAAVNCKGSHWTVWQSPMFVICTHSLTNMIKSTPFSFPPTSSKSGIFRYPSHVSKNLGRTRNHDFATSICSQELADVVSPRQSNLLVRKLTMSCNVDISSLLYAERKSWLPIKYITASIHCVLCATGVFYVTRPPHIKYVHTISRPAGHQFVPHHYSCLH